jgi:hypothetical protein
VEEDSHPALPSGGDFHQDHKFSIGIVPSSYREALYWDSPATSFFQVGMQAEAHAELHNTLMEEDLDAERFEEARYDDQPFFKKEPGMPDFARDHPFTIGFAPANYREALYWDSPASAFFQEEETSSPDSEVGEDFRVSPHGRTEDVNDPDYEINHPTVHKHSKNVIGTKQEGHLFWTDTSQPNMDNYESTHDEKIRTANTVEADDQAFAQESAADVEANAVDISCTDDCDKIIQN